MAATARRRDPADEDIAAIAKQISDQAEAIYQNWKARGLAPGELIACHAAGDGSKLGTMLKPVSATTTPVVSKPTIEILAQAPTMDNNRLEKLVKKFVVEDKARIAAAAAAARNKPIPSSIQNALDKFENNAKNANAIYKQSMPMTKPVIAEKPKLLPKPRISDTIEMILPKDISTSSTPTTNGLQTWPLKNRVVENHTSKRKTITVVTDMVDDVPLDKRLTSTIIANERVVTEEKRLISALRNGVVACESLVLAEPAVSNAADAEVEITTNTVPLGSTNGYDVNGQTHCTEIISSSNQSLKQQTRPNPVRPFLTRGSVAERILIFERCPGPLPEKKFTRNSIAPVKNLQPIVNQCHATLQRHVRANKNVNIPRFYFPTGKPSPDFNNNHVKSIRSNLITEFNRIGSPVGLEHFGAITKICQLPLYWKTPLFLACCSENGVCTKEYVLNFWHSMVEVHQCNDAAAKFVHILSRGRRQWLAPEDFIPLVQDVVESHPGLIFLKEATEFHSRYVHTVIARIYYCVNRSWSGRISMAELRRSNLLSVIQMLEEEEDINQITQYFSYEHFYVIYCKFWELDRDHDLFIDKRDLDRHNEHALSTRIIDRIFSGCVTRNNRRLTNGGQCSGKAEDTAKSRDMWRQTNNGNTSDDKERMSYTEFVWFLLSEEDKHHPTAIEYWFRCMDLDGDGYLSMYELEYFYEEQVQRLESIGIETLPFHDCICQMLDMIKPRNRNLISLSDLKRCKMTPIFFDTFFNKEKYLDHEHRDPFASQRGDQDVQDGQEVISDWDRYAAEEYELLVAEEGANDQPDSSSISLDDTKDGYEEEDDVEDVENDCQKTGPLELCIENQGCDSDLVGKKLGIVNVTLASDVGGVTSTTRQRVDGEYMFPLSDSDECSI